METIFFTPGPSQLYPTAAGHITTAIREQILSISHRSKQFISIYAETESNLRQLLAIPEGHQVFFLSSANEAWERILQNAVWNESLHFVNGEFSDKFYQFARQLGLQPQKIRAGAGEGFSDPEIYDDQITEGVELVACCMNETSTGVITTGEFIRELSGLHTGKLIAVDVVSAFPFYADQLDWSRSDFVYFSVQKGFGMPAGLGVLIVSEEGFSAGSSGTYHSFSALAEKARKHQTPETPNVLGIYLLGKIAGDMIQKGMDIIRAETRQKAGMLYAAIERHPDLQIAVQNPDLRSETVIVADCPDPDACIRFVRDEANMLIGAGYGSRKKTQIRIANFPAHSVQDMERLIATLENWRN